MTIPIDEQFQTKSVIVDYMIRLIPEHVVSVLEPSKGLGNISSKLKKEGYKVTTPDDFFLLDKELSFDCIVMNPPFSSKSAYLEKAPRDIDLRGMRVGYYFLTECMKKSNHVIALVPWFTISDSDVRLRNIMNYGLKSITTLSRKSFDYARIQTCILELEKGYLGSTDFRFFDVINEEKNQ